ncbi:alpha/beta fold hydrolase [Actinomadura parmotrematis]|uniref:Alpha/beta fold hydrolase n=1 Tax=Actinomadura parmotrematis TaxID=2864039 RepID=A0ABS7G0I8_9ACTN|nr:alpha/beta fold hydrolase [Actinomadura parmotrematis]MBW8485715.1 alpha/beta fold hydrolase [Actinomadura parmotrematis]
MTVLDYEIVGEGRPLVLLHGFYGDRTTWTASGHVAGLAGDFRLVLVDLPGHGRSPAPHDPIPYALHRQADDVAAVLDDAGIGRAAVWGSSLGGTVALTLLARHPGRVGALIANGAHAEAASGDPEPENTIFREQGMAPFLAMLGPVPDGIRAPMERADPLALAALNSALAEIPALPGALAAPILLLVGEKDRALARARESAGRIPGARLVELPGCGHLDSFTRTDLTLPLVREFLAGGAGVAW